MDIDKEQDNDQKKKDTKEPRVGQGFSDARGDSFRQKPGVPKNNGLNVNNDPQHQREKEKEKEQSK